MTYSQRTLSDPRTLRALAHPVRIGILEQLTVHGAMTATELAERLDETPSNCSWHLRKLAENGFVEEAEGVAGRKRPWQAVDQGMVWGDADESPELARAGDALNQIMIERAMARYGAAQARRRDESPAWQEATTVTQSMLWLTAEELDGINMGVRELMMSKIDRFEHPDRRPDGARLCAFLAWGAPAYDMGTAPDEVGTGA
jgi:DNA-binding transcriptional ArsR family regulator